ncbi:hypothetical protein BgAZ_301610 [Babesia gibsoni]|uniref:Uncharacterized protein n=1 Tax=Babesia gibsoni TaxID=33632 RepID=A0AAD8LNE5_BABGI|nr:hypothetical protein BgAZ_301610 [Babesia gibsoni]
MKPLFRKNAHNGQQVSDDNVVGEILEDIECLRLGDSESDNYDELNDDTFGGGAESLWDPTETFQEALKEESSSFRRKPREPRELVKSELFDFPEPQRSPKRSGRKLRGSADGSNQTNGQSKPDEQRSGRQYAQAKEAEEEFDRSDMWETDLGSYRRLGFFELNDHLMELVSKNEISIPQRWRVSQRTLDRHSRGVKRSKENMGKELFMDEQSFDQILRIHLTQICKDPRLQNYTGKWNARHLGIVKPNQSPDPNQTQTEAPDADSAEMKSVLNPNRFGKTSSASVRHGRRLIQLNSFITKPHDGPVSKERTLRETIEFGYEALYMLCDIEEEIEQCPMNHVAALDKMHKDREGRLNQLFVSLTTGVNTIEDIMALNKGRKLMLKLGRKLSIETKLQLACCITGCIPTLIRIFQEADLVLTDHADLTDVIALFSSSYNLRPLVAFEREDNEVTDVPGFAVHQMMYESNSYVQCYLFIIECLTMAGHLFLLTTPTGGRQNALQRCCTTLINSEQECGGFSKLLLIRSGVVFVNVLLERVCHNPIAVEKATLDLILHYTLEISENISSHGQEWQSLAATIMKLFN